MTFDPDRLLAGLPHFSIAHLPFGTFVPRRRSVGNLSDYNGFTGKERLRTFEVAKWLVAQGAMHLLPACHICGEPARGQLAEDYYDLTTWMEICNRCHGRLHKRFNNWSAWQQRLDAFHVPEEHWARLVSTKPFDLADLLRSRGLHEPSYADFVTAS